MIETSNILGNFGDKHARLFDEQTILIQHKLLETGLFSEEALGGLIDRCKPEDYIVSTMNLHRIMDRDPVYQKVLDQIFSEFEGKIPGLKTFRRNMTLLISSPNIQVYSQTRLCLSTDTCIHFTRIN